MCIIVDTNVFPEVILCDYPVTDAFKAVRNHIDSRKSKLIWGGTTLERELKGHLRLIKLMKDANKVVIADKAHVDAVENQLKKNFPEKRFDDQHIVALTIVANARLVCTADSTLQDYLKNSAVFPKGFKKPLICTKSSPAKVVPIRPFSNLCNLCKG